MPGTFPTLKSGKVAQYPLPREERMAAEVLRFLDFTEQVYVDVAAGARRRAWSIDLQQLDDNEVATLKAFFESNQGSQGTFQFTDPWDGQVFTACSFAHDAFPQTQSDEGVNATQLLVYEHP